MVSIVTLAYQLKAQRQVFLGEPGSVPTTGTEPRLMAAQRRAVRLEGVRRAREAEKNFEQNGLAGTDVEAASGETR